MELAVAVSRAVKVMEAPGKRLEMTIVCSSVNTPKNVTGAGTFGMGTTGPLTVTVSGVPKGKLEHGSEASKDTIFESAEEGK